MGNQNKYVMESRGGQIEKSLTSILLTLVLLFGDNIIKRILYTMSKKTSSME